VATWDGLGANLWVLSEKGGKVLAQFEGLARIHTLTSRADRVAVGLDDGRVMLFNQELFCRRLNDDENGAAEPADELLSGDSPSRLSLQEKLRALRK
jgi:hypothetical protein